MTRDDFEQLQRGSAVIRWSPSGEMDRFVVIRLAHLRETPSAGLNPGFVVGWIKDDHSVSIANTDGERHFWSWHDHEVEGSFGYTFVALPEAFQLPEYVK